MSKELQVVSKETQESILDAISRGMRFDGRQPLEYRDVKVTYDVTRNAEGSCIVQIGDTKVIAGVKMEVMKPYADAPDKGSLMVNVELLPLSSPSFERGPPSMDAIEYARVTDRAIRESGCIDFKELCIEEGEAAWMIIVDVCTLNDAGNLLDAIGLAAIGAIKNAKFPELVDGQPDYKNRTDKPIPLKHIPISSTIYKVGDQLIADPTEYEMPGISGRLTVGVLESGELCSMQKGGEAVFTLDEIEQAIDFIIKQSEKLRKAL
ncbi:exosome complex protein Rrp42 [Candidatus Woesearchaeota archaeon]|nr:MAG: exosome complex protein Rrp42 [Candidatus Woesearchaeota archaeon]